MRWLFPFACAGLLLVTLGQQDCQDADHDGDGWTAEDGDCDDNDATSHPGAEEICDEVDNDCDEVVDNIREYSLWFDGSDDKIHIGDDEMLDITTAITMEAWIYSEDPNNDEPVLAKESSDGRQQYWFGVYYGGFGLLLGNGSGWGLAARSDGYITASTWMHIASVWDGTTYYNYQDGVLVGSGTYSTTLPTGDQPLTIAINSGYDNTRYMGNLSDVRLWNVARSEDEIERDMYSISDDTGLVGRWLLDEGSGQVANDVSGNGFDGTLGSSSEEDSRDPTWSDNVSGCE